MPKLHLYPIFHVVQDVKRTVGPLEIGQAEAALARELEAVEFSLAQGLTAEFAGAFDRSRVRIGSKRSGNSVSNFIVNLDSLIDGEEDELAQMLRPIREFLQGLHD